MRNKIKVLTIAILCWQGLFSQDNNVTYPSAAKTPSFELAIGQAGAMLFVPETYSKIEGSPIFLLNGLMQGSNSLTPGNLIV
jgi:hypothetical protein